MPQVQAEGKDNVICFITAVNNAEKYNESLETWKQLDVPQGMAVESVVIEGALSMTDAYQQGMEQAEAKYKIYIHQDVWIMQKNFLQVMVDAFRQDEQLGLAGVVGSKTIPASGIWWEGELIGSICDNHFSDLQMRTFLYERNSKKVMEAAAVDGLLLMTQYDVPWRTDLFKNWHFYDISQCLEFRKRGYTVGLLPQPVPGVYHWCNSKALDENYEEARRIFIHEYAESL